MVIDVVCIVSIIAVIDDAIRGIRSIVPCSCSSRRDIIVLINDDDVATDNDFAEATCPHLNQNGTWGRKEMDAKSLLTSAVGVVSTMFVWYLSISFSPDGFV